MTRRITNIIMIFFITIVSKAQSGTFDFTGASGGSGTSSQVTETVSSVTLTCSASGGVILGSGTFGVISGDYASQYSAASTVTFSFSATVNISTIDLINDITPAADQTMVFTPNPTGSNSTVSQSIGNTNGNTVTLNFLSITSFTVTKSGGGTFKYDFDDVVMDASLTPVELVSFTGEAHGTEVILNWETATEINNFGFSVQRKIENGSWKEIGFVHGYGNSYSPKYYSFVDQSPLGGEVLYRIKQIDFDGGFKYYGPVSAVVNIARFTLNQNFPNPFNPVTTISYWLPEKANVKLVVFDILGREVAELVNEEQASGIYSVKFDGSNFNSGISSQGGYASGVYFYKITAGGFTAVKKLLLVK